MPKKTVKKAEGLLKGDDDIQTYTAYVGQGSPRFWLGLNPQLPNEAFAEIVILAKNVEARERVKAKIEQAAADGALNEARVRVDRFNFGPPVGFPVQEARPAPCPKIYAPVICDNGKVYPNQCWADRRNAENCVPVGFPFEEAKRGGPPCPKIWAPVICDNGKTYPNQCEADRHNAENCVPAGFP